MDLNQLIKHPELLDQETLYDLRSLVAMHPTFQTARLLMLKNLYILHDSTFDEELRRASLYITNKTVLFEMIEATYYKIKKTKIDENNNKAELKEKNRTGSLIDTYLNEESETIKQKDTQKTAYVDPTTDYMAYLLAQEEQQMSGENQMQGQDLIDNFINKQGKKITLQENIEYKPEDNLLENKEEESYFTETLAHIYIKQGQYSKALKIIKRLNLNYPEKSVYFADQIHLLEKLIANNNK